MSVGIASVGTCDDPTGDIDDQRRPASGPVPTTGAPSSGTRSALAAPFQRLRRHLAATQLDRDEVIESLLLAVLSREHAFVLGPPGTGKSALVRELFSALPGECFEQTLSRTRPDAAVLGPYDLPGLRDEGHYRRRIGGYLLSARWAFLDEIGEMSPTLGHELHAALNERIRHEVAGGRSSHPIPLHSAITAGNRVPGNGDGDAAALWDRILVRCRIDYLADTAHVRELLVRAAAVGAPEHPPRITEAQLARACEAVPQVTVPADVIAATVEIRNRLHGEGLVSSDRRWAQSIRLLQAHALLHERDIATLADLRALRFTLWSDASQIAAVERAILVHVDPLDARRSDLLDLLDLVERALDQGHTASAQVRVALRAQTERKIGQIETLLKPVRAQWRTAKRDPAPLTALSVRLRSVRSRAVKLTDPTRADLTTSSVTAERLAP